MIMDKGLPTSGQKFVRLEQHCAGGQSEMHGGAAQAQEGRREFYRAAALAVDMMVNHKEELQARVANDGFTGERWFDDWVEQWLAPLVQIGEDPHELLAAIQQGMTEREYMAKGPFIKKQGGR